MSAALWPAAAQPDPSCRDDGIGLQVVITGPTMANGVLPNLLPFSGLGESYALSCSFAEGLDATPGLAEVSRTPVHPFRSGHIRGPGPIHQRWC
jgi:hypothetical protein